jgi:hypothetical protein
VLIIIVLSSIPTRGIDKSQPSAPDPEDNKPPVEWDLDEAWRTRLFKTIMEAFDRTEETGARGRETTNCAD